MRPALTRTLLLVLALCVSAGVSRAAETVTLRTGFSVRCTSVEHLSTQTTRLHLAGNNADNYMDVAADAIASVEPAPPEITADVPKPPADFTSSLLQDSGQRHNVNVALLASVVQAESGGNAHAVSRTGARGLMQLMPGTAAELGVHDSFAPEENVNGGSAYLDTLLTRYHDDLPLALAAYNAGPAAVDRYHGIPPFRETRAYVARVIREFNRRVLLARQTAAQ